MNSLAIVTHENPASFALNFNGKIFDHIFLNDKRVAETISLELNAIMNQNNGSIKDIDSVIVISGPGSYTGLRVGMAFAKALCQFNTKSLFAVDALDVLYYKFGKSATPVIEARNRRVYTKFNEKIEIIEVDDLLKKVPNSNFVGSGSYYFTSKNDETNEGKINAIDLLNYFEKNKKSLKNYNMNFEEFVKLIPIYVQEARIG